MNRNPAGQRTYRGETGYALLMLVFLTAVMLIAAAAAAPRLLTQGLRQKEDEMVWRGEQYARAVRLYYRKYGRFPQSLEDLIKENNGVRFLRRAYADPMNREDGSWRLIYVAANGQLIGSVKRRSLLQFPAAPTAPGAGSSQVLGSPAGPAGQTQPPSGTGGVSPGTGPPPEVIPQEGEQPPATPPTATPAEPPGRPQPPPQPSGTAGSILGGSTDGKVFGANIIGVGSKVNRRSFRVYDGGTTYLEWEFIWDPTKDAVGVGQPAGAVTQPSKGVLADTPSQVPLSPPRRP